ncbi:MAG TPA: ligand-gated channel protein, partial [Archangium sp.]
MRRSHLAGRLLCLALSTSGSALAQQAARSPQDTPAQDTPEGEPFRVPTVEVVEKATAPEPSDSASRRDPSGALTVIHVDEFGGAAR